MLLSSAAVTLALVSFKILFFKSEKGNMEVGGFFWGGCVGVHADIRIRLASSDGSVGRE